MPRSWLQDRHGRSIYPIGVNYWPRRTAVEMWTRWDPEGIDQDLREMKALGLNVIRFFLRTADFADEEANLRPEALERLDGFIALCKKHGLYVLPSLLVGHMSGMNFPIPWDRGPNSDFYTDPETLARSRKFARAIVERYRDEETILGWLLSNEITHYAGKRETHLLLSWMRELYRVIKTLDQRPVAPGDGADDLKGRGLGYPEGALEGPGELRKGMDFVSLHHYYGMYYGGDAATPRFSHAPAAMVRLCDIGLPVLVEEFGVSTALWSEQAQADYFRVVLFSTWAAGAAGALAWCWSDFPTTDLPPYTHHPHELSFGITRADGSEKPAAREMSRFARLIAQVGPTDWAPCRPQAAILVPSTFYVNYPFRRVDRLQLLETLLEAYALARMAGLSVTFIREPALPPEGVRLLLVPFADLLAPTWHELRSWVEAGGVLWAGFGNAVPTSVLEGLFGVRVGRRLELLAQPRSRPGPGAVDNATAGSMELRLIEPFGDLAPGERLAFPASAPEIGAEAPHLPIVPTKAKVLAVEVEGDGRPALTVHSVGRGKAFFCPRSLEWLLATGVGSPHSGPGRSRAPAARLYRALRNEASIVPPFDTTQPALSLSVLEGEEGAQLLVAINHSDAPLEEEVCCRRPAKRVVDVESGEGLRVQDGRFRLTLGPWGVRVLRAEV